MPEQKKYSAAEIAAMKLPGLPTTKAKVLARAEREEWHYETKVGLGGVRRMFVIPQAYLNVNAEESETILSAASRSNRNSSNDEATTFDIPRKRDNVVGAIADGEQVNTARLASAIRALDEYLTENNLVIDDPDRKAEIVTFLYKYLEKKASEGDVKELLHLVTG
ncbi:MAG: DNA-binding protein [Undibacterium umbellatum]|uniref:DNA-binding protein n=1 Tax=Undibacterium umbellatum TaxID=2762300 RepID=UPI003BB5B4F1